MNDLNIRVVSFRIPNLLTVIKDIHKLIDGGEGNFTLKEMFNTFKELNGEWIDGDNFVDRFGYNAEPLIKLLDLEVQYFEEYNIEEEISDEYKQALKWQESLSEKEMEYLHIICSDLHIGPAC